MGSRTEPPWIQGYDCIRKGKALRRRKELYCKPRWRWWGREKHWNISREEALQTVWEPYHDYYRLLYKQQLHSNNNPNKSSAICTWETVSKLWQTPLKQHMTNSILNGGYSYRSGVRTIQAPYLTLTSRKIKPLQGADEKNSTWQQRLWEKRCSLRAHSKHLLTCQGLKEMQKWPCDMRPLALCNSTREAEATEGMAPASSPDSTSFCSEQTERGPTNPHPTHADNQRKKTSFKTDCSERLWGIVQTQDTYTQDGSYTLS